MRIYHIDCLPTERFLIRTFGTRALNIEGKDRMKKIPNILSSTSLKHTNTRNSRKRKRKPNTSTQSARLATVAPMPRMLQKGRHSYIRNVIIPVLFMCNNNTYTNLLTILNMNMNKTINITIYPTKRKNKAHYTMSHIKKYYTA